MAAPLRHLVEGRADELVLLGRELPLDGLQGRHLVGLVVHEGSVSDVADHVLAPLRVEAVELGPHGCWEGGW